MINYAMAIRHRKLALMELQGKEGDEEGHWVTINGAHVFIGGPDTGGGNSGSGRLNQSERSAVEEYTNTAFTRVNEAMRSGHKLSASDSKLVKNLRSGLAKLPEYKGTVTRTVNFQSSAAADKFFNSHEEGDTVVYHQFVSTSKHQRFAAQISIRSKHGRDISGVSNLKGENEVLFMPETKFRVDSVRKTPLGWKLKLSEE